MQLREMHCTPQVQVEIITLGTMRGPAPAGGDALVVDLTDRLHNPDKHSDLRGLTGVDLGMRAHVMSTPGAEQVVVQILTRVRALLPGRQPQVHGPLRLQIQCRWGRHRSPAIAEEIADRLSEQGVTVHVLHRDVDLEPLRREVGCSFCDISHGDAPAEILREWPDVLAIRPRRGGVVPGHALIIPRPHVADFTSDPAISALVMAAASQYAAEQEEDEWNYISSAGRNATQTQFHQHGHLLPRRAGDRLLLPWSVTER